MTFDILLWNYYLKKVKLYINKNKYKPSKKNKDNNIKKLGSWLNTQKKYYNNNIITSFLDIDIKKTNIMNINNIKLKWEQFINEYKDYFLSNEEIWNNYLNQVIFYINENKSKPPYNDKYKKLNQWIYTQLSNYKNNEQIMKNNNIKLKWINFMNEYKEYFLSKEELWDNNLKQVILFINENNYKPSQYSDDINIKKLGSWIFNQQTNYKNNTKNMKDNNIKIKWEQFINKYNEYFLSNENAWYNNLEKINTYIIQNNCKPSRYNKNLNIKKLAIWFDRQKINYKYHKSIMKNDKIRLKWEQFIKKNC